jgi:prepilin-type processing-associated H-X9-DG protein
MDSNPYESPAARNEAASRAGSLGKRLFFTMLAVLGGLGFLVALLLPAMRPSREAGRRAHCFNNLKQIALGLNLYCEEYGALPPAYTVDKDGKPLHSWRTLILPFMEQKALYNVIDLTKPWDDPANQKARDAILPMYLCLSKDGSMNQSTYLAIVAPGGCFLATESRKLSDITDDHAKTLMVIEVDKDHSVPWMSPVDADEALILSLTKSASLPHREGMHAAFVDGHVAYLSMDTEAKILRAMISIAGNDDEALDED